MLDETCNLAGLTTTAEVEQHDVQYLWPRLGEDEEGLAMGRGRTVAHVFDLATHEDDDRVVRESLDKSLSPGLVLAGRDAWREFITLDWENKSECAGKGRGLTN